MEKCCGIVGRRKKRQGLSQIKDDLFVEFFCSGGVKGSKELNIFVFVFAIKTMLEGERKYKEKTL